jgi:hypothetical protein
MHDPDQVLAFYTVVEAIEETASAQDGSLRACVAAATLVARVLQPCPTEDAHHVHLLPRLTGVRCR